MSDGDLSEEWRTIPGYEGVYEASNAGRIRSLDRRDRLGHLRNGRILKLRLDRYGYLRFHAGGKPRRVLTVHRLILLAFAGQPPLGANEARHLDGDPTNNQLSNLQWGSSAENKADQLRHGTHGNAAKTHCPKDHPYDEANTYTPPGTNNRVCRACHRARYKEMAA